MLKSFKCHLNPHNANGLSVVPFSALKELLPCVMDWLPGSNKGQPHSSYLNCVGFLPSVPIPCSHFKQELPFLRRK